MSKNGEIITQLNQAVEEYLHSLSFQQAPVVGWCCSYFPVEILESAGLVPLRLLPHPPAEMGDACLNPNFCPYVRAIMGEGLAGTYPFLSGLVIMNTCDGMRRLFDAWSYFRRPGFVHLMDLPRITVPSAIEYFREEALRLVERISSHFGTAISNPALIASFEASNRTYALSQQVQNLMSQGRSNLAAWELTEVFRAGGILPRERYHLFLKRVIDESDGGKNRRGVPILVTGSMLESPEIMSMIEEWGGKVVAQDLCVSGRGLNGPIPLVTDDPLMALADHYLLRAPCARMQETKRRIDHLLSLIRAERVKGVVYYVMKFCDTFLYESPGLKQILDQMGIPMLIIESEYRRGGGGAMGTRIQAFLEMLGASEDLD